MMKSGSVALGIPFLLQAQGCDGRMGFQVQDVRMCREPSLGTGVQEQGTGQRGNGAATGDGVLTLLC